MKKTATSWGETIQKLRKTKGMTQKALSGVSGVSYSTLSKLEVNLISNPSVNTLSKLSRALGVSLVNISFDEKADNNSPPTAMGLFCGCGGLDLGFKQAGFRIVYANDILKNAEATYRYNIGSIDMGDFRAMSKADLPYADVVLAGIPCQPFSNAGNRQSTLDERGQLFAEVMQTLDIKKPKIVILENVRGFMSSKDENGLLMPERIRLEFKKHGYRLYYELLNSADYEVPQNRYRVIMVGVRKDLTVDYIFPQTMPRSDKQKIGYVLSRPLPADEKEEVWQLSPQALKLVRDIPEGGSWKQIPYAKLPARLKRIRNDMQRYHSPNFYRRFARDEIMGTITAAATPENSGIVHPLEDRRYSVREIARFQTFPDDFKFIGTSIASKYALIGNAVPVRLGYHIGVSVYNFLEEHASRDTLYRHGQGLPHGLNNRWRRNTRQPAGNHPAVPKVG